MNLHQGQPWILAAVMGSLSSMLVLLVSLTNRLYNKTINCQCSLGSIVINGPLWNSSCIARKDLNCRQGVYYMRECCTCSAFTPHKILLK